MSQYTQITEQSLRQFKELVLSRTNIDAEQYDNFQKLDKVLRPIFQELYYGNIEFAKHIISGSESVDFIQENGTVIENVDKVANNTKGMKSAIAKVEQNLKSGVPILCAAFNDNHGLTALSINESVNTIVDSNIGWEVQSQELGRYSIHEQTINKLVKKRDLNADSEFLLVTLGMGSQQRAFQEVFAKQYPNATWLIVDHQTIDINYQIDATKPNTIWVSPYGNSALSEGKRVKLSSGYLYHLIVSQALNKIDNNHEANAVVLKAIENAGVMCNRLAAVEADVRVMPSKSNQLNALSKIEGFLKSTINNEWLSKDNVDDLKAQFLALDKPQSAQQAQRIADDIRYQIEMVRSAVSIVESDEVKKQPEFAKEKFVERVMYDKGERELSNDIARLKVHAVHYTVNANVNSTMSQVVNEVMPRLTKTLNSASSRIKEMLRDSKAVDVIEMSRIGIIKPSQAINSPLFGAKDWLSAFSMKDKAVQLFTHDVASSEPVFTVRSSLPFNQVVALLKKAHPQIDIRTLGNSYACDLMMSLPNKQPLDLKTQKVIFKTIDQIALDVESNMPSEPKVNVDMMTVDTLLAVNEATRASAYIFDDYQVKGLLDISPDMTIKLDKKFRKVDAETLIEDDLWLSHSIALDFDNKKRVILPTRLLKELVDDGYNGKLSVSQIQRGIMMVNGYVSNKDIKSENVVKFETKLNAQKEEVIRYYNDELDVNKVRELGRDEMINAIGFTADKAGAYYDNEALIIGLLDKSKREAFAVLDVEANDGGLAPQCYNLGIVAYALIPESGKEITPQDYAKNKFSNEIKNAALLPTGNYIINRELKARKLSLIVNENDMALPIKSERLTNMDSSMVRREGMPAARAEMLALDFLGEYDSCITQAHNYLGYDLNAIAANFPNLYNEIMKDGISDSLLPARSFAIGQGSILVAGLGVQGSKQAFVTTPGSRFNIVDKLRDKSLEEFSFPDVKGNSLLWVVGQDVYLKSASDDVGAKLSVSRDQLAIRMVANSKPTFDKSVKSGVQDLLKFATINDMLKATASGQRTQVSFNSVGGKVSQTIQNAFFKIQEHFDPSLSMTQNLNSFFKNNPKVLASLDESFDMPIDEQPQGLLDVKLKLNGAPKKLKKDETDPRISTSMKELLMFNMQEFCEANKENFAYGMDSWMYAIVLNELDPLSASKDMLRNVANQKAIPFDLVAEIGDTAKTYMIRTGRPSLFQKEWHNNVNLDGDDYQECNVNSHLMVSKVNDPFTPRHDVSGVVAKMYPSIVSATVNARAKALFTRNTPTMAVNSHSYKQLRVFDVVSRGMTDAEIDKKYVSIEVKKDGKDKILVRLPELKIGEFEKFTDEMKARIIDSTQTLVNVLMLNNSVSDKTPEMIKDLIAAIQNSEATRQHVEFIKDISPSINVDNTADKKRLVDVIDQLADSLQNGEPISLPANKFITPEEIDALEVSLRDIIGGIKDTLQVNLTERVGACIDLLKIKKQEYECINIAKQTGSNKHIKDYDHIKSRGLSMANTQMANHAASISGHIGAQLPELAKTMIAKKTDVTLALFASDRDMPLSQLIELHVPELKAEGVDDFALTQEATIKR